MSESGETHVLLDEALIVELENLGGDVLTNLLPMYFDEAADQVSELSGAIVRGEAPTVAQAAHKLRGGSSAIGAAHVSQIASELEATATAGDLTAADQLLDQLRSGLDETSKAFRGRAAQATDHGDLAA
jgi:HPt (histidine-containing phosphotransfer) domain-containing protein